LAAVGMKAEMFWMPSRNPTSRTLTSMPGFIALVSVSARAPVSGP
jgi:hypothetical protein